MENDNIWKTPLDWLSLRQGSAMPKLPEICQNPKHLFDNYYQIGDSEYVFASHQWNPEFTEKAIFVLAFYWAPTPAIFRRLTSRDPNIIARDEGITEALPTGLMLEPPCKDCGAIMSFIEANIDIRYGWQNEYDNNVVPVPSGCCLSVERLTYYFRSSIPVPTDEAPYAVQLVTSDYRWKKIGGGN